MSCSDSAVLPPSALKWAAEQRPSESRHIKCNMTYNTAQTSECHRL